MAMLVNMAIRASHVQLFWIFMLFQAVNTVKLNLKAGLFFQLFNLSTRSWLNRNVSLHGNIHGKNTNNNKVAQKIFSNF